MEINLDNIKIYIMDDYEQMSKKSAGFMCEQINAKPSSVLGLATGSTPIGMYKELASLYRENKVDFSQITTFNLDEYYPIQKDNNQSYHYFMRDNLFKHINIDINKTNLPNGEAADVLQECEDYENKIKAAGGIDLQLLGIGLNGHIGFNEPAASIRPKTSLFRLDDSTINANARFFANRDEVPEQAISMSIKTIMMAKKILLLVSGDKKAKIIKEAVYGDITPILPASLLQLHQDVVIVLDKEAGQYFL